MRWENVLADVKDRGVVAIRAVAANADDAGLRVRLAKLVRDRRRAAIAGSAVVLVAALAYAMWPQSAPPATAAAASNLPRVTVSKVQMTRLAPQMTLAGTVVSRNDSQLASDVEGRVSWIADVGTVVQAGDVVARLDKSVAGMQLASDKANVTRLAAQLRYDRDQASRMQNLFSQSAIAKATRDQAISTRDEDSAALAQAQAAVNKSQYEFDHSEIRAPFPGRVVARLVNAGEYATAGKPIARLVDIGSIEVSAQAPIQTAEYLREGMPVTTLIEDKPVAATVRAIVPVGDQLSRTMEIRLTLAPGAAFVGDAAKVIVPSGQPHLALAVPRDALILREDATYLFKLDRNNAALRVPVETGTIEGDIVEVRGQIAPGDRVIVRGAERLETGQKVRLSAAS